MATGYRSAFIFLLLWRMSGVPHSFAISPTWRWHYYWMSSFALAFLRSRQAANVPLAEPVLAEHYRRPLVGSPQRPSNRMVPPAACANIQRTTSTGMDRHGCCSKIADTYSGWRKPPPTRHDLSEVRCESKNRQRGLRTMACTRLPSFCSSQWNTARVP